MSFRGGGQRVILPFGLDWADIQQNATETLEYAMPVNGKPTDLEMECYQQFKNLTQLMKDSSFYTGNLKSISTEESGKKKNSVYLEGGANDGLKRYSDKYRKRITIGKSITDHPFILKYFPEELHSVMASKSGKKKSLGVSKYKKGSKNMDIDKLIKSAEERQKEIMDRLNEVAANVNDEDVAEDEEEEENFDDDFEDDDDDDYNAEKYFDDGDDFDEGGDDGDEEAAF